MVIKFKYGTGCIINTSVTFFLVLIFKNILKSQTAKITQIIKLTENQKQLFYMIFHIDYFLYDLKKKSDIVL